MSPLRYELGFYIPEDGILHSDCCEYLKSYIALTDWALKGRRNVYPVKYELSFYVPEEDILHSHRRENLKSYPPETGLSYDKSLGLFPSIWSRLIRVSPVCPSQYQPSRDCAVEWPTSGHVPGICLEG
jgi:hypothetical protein